MPIFACIEARWLRIEAVGRYSYDDVVEAFDGAIAKYEGRLPVLVDARHSLANPPYHELRATAAYADSIAHRIGPGVALVVDGVLRYGLARMLSAFGNTRGVIDYHPFHELREAERWLESQPSVALVNQSSGSGDQPR